MKVDELISVEGARCLITGSTRGIGRELAGVLVDLGMDIWVHGRNESDAKRVADSLGCRWVSGDLGVPSEVDAIAEKITSETDHLDAIINNAGMESVRAVGKIDREVLEASLQVNLVAPILLIESLLAMLKKSENAAIINVTSIHDQVPYPHNAVYSATKAALAMYTKTAAVELAPLGIRVNNLAPGAIETEINSEVIDAVGREKFENWIPMGKIGKAKDLAATVVLLLSSGSGYSTGSTIYVDGGYMHNLLRYRP